MEETFTAAKIDFVQLGRDARVSAADAFDKLPPAAEVYWFVLDNPDCFVGSSDRNDKWPADMPAEPPVDFIAGYSEAQ